MSFDHRSFSRRNFVAGMGALLLQPLVGGEECASSVRTKEKPVLRFGVVTDLHYGDIDDSDSRHYRQSLPKLAEAVKEFNVRKVDFMIELGDFKDRGRVDGKDSVETTLRFARDIEKVFATFNGPRYHVLGNHDTDCVNLNDILPIYANTGVQSGTAYYSFTARGIRCLVLDANYNREMQHYAGNPVNFTWTDSNLPPEQIDWLESELATANAPIIVFVHQRLDPKASELVRVKNSEKIRKILENSRKVIGVFQGHDHPGEVVVEIERGITYYTLPAMVDGLANSYVEVAVYPSGAITLSHIREFGGGERD